MVASIYCLTAFLRPFRRFPCSIFLSRCALVSSISQAKNFNSHISPHFPSLLDTVAAVTSAYVMFSQIPGKMAKTDHIVAKHFAVREIS
jgi:hypothetical protein